MGSSIREHLSDEIIRHPKPYDVYVGCTMFTTARAIVPDPPKYGCAAYGCTSYHQRRIRCKRPVPFPSTPGCHLCGSRIPEGPTCPAPRAPSPALPWFPRQPQRRQGWSERWSPLPRRGSSGQPASASVTDISNQNANDIDIDHDSPARIKANTEVK